MMFRYLANLFVAWIFKPLLDPGLLVLHLFVVDVHGLSRLQVMMLQRLERRSAAP